FGFADQAINHGLLERGGDIGHFLGTQRSWRSFMWSLNEFSRRGNLITHRGFEAAKAEVQPVGVVEQRSREAEFDRISATSGPFDCGPAGIRQGEQDSE